jgi:hypothetical protein
MTWARSAPFFASCALSLLAITLVLVIVAMRRRSLGVASCAGVLLTTLLMVMAIYAATSSHFAESSSAIWVRACVSGVAFAAAIATGHASLGWLMPQPSPVSLGWRWSSPRLGRVTRNEGEIPWPRPERRDFFLSYKSEDANLARQLAEHLVAAGFTLWFAEYEILLADYAGFDAALKHGTATCDFGLLLTSPAYWDSPYCKQEALLLSNNLPARRVIDIGVSMSRGVSDLLATVATECGLDVRRSVMPRLVAAQQTRFCARCTEIGFLTTGFRLVNWNNRTIDGSDQVAFRSLDPQIPLEFNVHFDFNLEYAPGKPYTMIGKRSVDDRRLYDERREFVGWWMAEMRRCEATLIEEGLHLIWRDGRTHVALTHRVADRWMRKYSLIMDGAGLSRPTEVILTFFIRGGVRDFCMATPAMDEVVESVCITREGSKTTTVGHKESA